MDTNTKTWSKSTLNGFSQKGYGSKCHILYDLRDWKPYQPTYVEISLKKRFIQKGSRDQSKSFPGGGGGGGGQGRTVPSNQESNE